MDPRFLLDTNVVSHLVRNPQGVVAIRIAEAGERRICTSIVVAAELRFDAAKRGSRRLTRQLDEILSAMEILPMDAPVDRHYATIRVHLEGSGNIIGPNDLLIAAHALAHDMTLVSANVSEFSRVPGLRVVNWLSDTEPARPAEPGRTEDQPPASTGP